MRPKGSAPPATAARFAETWGTQMTVIKEDAANWTGGCQCGAVRYQLLTPPEHACLCHCRMCQRWSAIHGVRECQARRPALDAREPVDLREFERRRAELLQCLWHPPDISPGKQRQHRRDNRQPGRPGSCTPDRAVWHRERAIMDQWAQSASCQAYRRLEARVPHPVGSVLHRSATASSPASFCAMMPEPTTAASRKAVPNHSQNARCGSAGISSALLPSPLRRPCGRSP